MRRRRVGVAQRQSVDHPGPRRWFNSSRLLHFKIPTLLSVVALIASTAFVIRAMESDPVAPSTVTVTVQTDDGASFRLNGRVLLADAATPDTVIVEIWKNGQQRIYQFPSAAADTNYGQQYLRLRRGGKFVPDSK